MKTFDVILIGLLAGSSSYTPPAAELHGVDLYPSPATAQLTGDDDTTLALTHTAGRIRIGSFVGGVAGNGYNGTSVVATTSGQHLAVSAGCWVTGVLTASASGGRPIVRYVVGDVALAAANAVKPTVAEIAAEIGSDQFVIVGDALFKRTSDLVIDTTIDPSRRPHYAYVEDKSFASYGTASQDNLVADVDDISTDSVHFDLAAASAKSAGQVVAKIWPTKSTLGSYLVNFGFDGKADGAGAGADLTFSVCDNTGTELGTLQLLLADTDNSATGLAVKETALGVKLSAAKWPLWIKLKTKTTVFSGGVGALYVQAAPLRRLGS